MKFDATRQPLSVILTLSVGLLALFWYRSSVAPLAVEHTQAIGFGLGGVVDDLCYGGRWWSGVVFGTAIALNAMNIARIVSSNMVLGMRTYMSILFYTIVGFGVYFGRDSLNEILAASLIVSGSQSFIAAFKRSYSFNPLFKTGLLFGLAPLFYPPSVVFLLLIPISLVLFMRKGREATVTLFGYFLPTLICSYVYWARGFEFLYFGQKCFEYIAGSYGYTLFHASMGIPRVVLLSLFVLLLGLSLGAFAAHVRETRARAYRVFFYFLWLFAISMLMFVLPSRSSATFIFAAIGLSVMMPYYFVKYTNVISTMLYVMIILTAIAVNIT